MTSGSPPGAPDLLTRVRARLDGALAPQALDIRDDSARHAGHPEAAGRRHLRVRVVSSRFDGLAPLQRHRLVYQALGAELAGELHALGIVARTPEEARRD